MADPNSQPGTPNLRQIHIQQPGEFYWASRHYSNEALNFICCCVIWTGYGPGLVARLFRRELNGQFYDPDPNNPNSNLPAIMTNDDLLGISTTEVRQCFYKMHDDGHQIYRDWIGRVPDEVLKNDVRSLMAPLANSGRALAHLKMSVARRGQAQQIWIRTPFRPDMF